MQYVKTSSVKSDNINIEISSIEINKSLIKQININ